MSSFRVAPLFAAGLLAAALLGASSPDEPPSPKEKWIHLESSNFSLYSSAPEKTARRLVTRLERLRQVLARNGKGASLELTRPTEIYVFRNQRAFLPFEPIGPDGKPQPLGGYFIPHGDRNVIALADWPDGDPIAPILHEYLHSLLDVAFERLPVWANEGLADFYSTFEIGDDGADIGRPVHDLVVASIQLKRMPTERLLAVSHGDPEYNEQERKNVFYAQSWLTTHYLLLGRPERRGDFGRYIDAVESGADPIAAFSGAFGLEPAAVEKELLTYTRRGTYPFLAMKFEELPALAPFTIRDVPYPEILARLGDLSRRVEVSYGERATAWIEAARKLDPASPVVAEALALDREDAGRREEAIALLREALARAPDYEPAQALLGRLLVAGSDRPAAAAAAEARQWLGRSVESEPGRLDSWIALGHAELGEGGSPKRAAAAFERAWRGAPDRTDVVGWYTYALAEDGQYARAAAILRATLLKSSDPEDLTSGRHYLKQLAEREVWGLANAGKYEDALARIGAYETAGVDAELAKSLAETRQRIERELAGNRCVDDFNAGIRAANEQKFSEARPLFEKVVADCSATDAALAARAQEVLAEIAKFDRKKKR